MEVRRIYSLPSASASLASAFTWNDRACSTPNYFICERLQTDGGYNDNGKYEIAEKTLCEVSKGWKRKYYSNTETRKQNNFYCTVTPLNDFLECWLNRNMIIYILKINLVRNI